MHVERVFAWSRDRSAIQGLLRCGFSHLSPQTGRAAFTASRLSIGWWWLAIPVFRMMAVLAERYEVFQAVRLGTLEVVHVELLLCTTPYTLKAVTQFCSEFPLCHLQRFLAG